MKQLLPLLLFFFTASCDGLRGGFPEVTPAQPAQGCNKDVRIDYRNNCSKVLIMYFIEVEPGTNINCQNLTDYGSFGENELKSVTIHKGKIGYFVFAEDSEGKCTGGRRKAEAWVNCEQATSDFINLNVCK